MKFEIKRYKKVIYWLGGILILIIALNIGINQWIKSELPAIIKEKNDTAYDFEFEDLRFSIFNSSISIEKVSIKPKADHDQPIPLVISANIGEISVVGVNFIKLLTKKDLSAYSIEINKPDITYTQPEKKDTTPNNSKLGNSINVSNFEINEGKFKLLSYKNQEKLAEINNIDIQIGGVNLSERTLEKDIPFTYTSFQLTCDSIYYKINPSQELKSNSLKVNDNLFLLKNFKISSIENIAKLNPKKLNYRLMPDISAPNVTFTGLDWGYDKTDEFYFRASILKFDSVDINVKNDKETNERKKDSLGYLIPFKLDIQKVLVGNSKLKIGNSLNAQNINIQIDKILNQKNKKLSIENVLLKNPSITTYVVQKETVKKVAQKVDFKDFIEVKNVKIENGTYKLNKHNKNQNLLKVNHINFEMAGIQMTPETFYEQIPITYQNVRLSAASIDYNPNHIYSIKAKKITLNNGDFSLSNFEMKSKISRTQFVRQLKKETDLYTLSANKIDVQNMNWGFEGKDMFFKVPKIDINTANANIYRSKIPADDTKKKLLYSKLLRDLPIILEVKKLNLKNSKVEYEEETENSTGAGKLTFANFNASIDNIYSGYKKSTVPDVKADIKTNFMNDSRLTAIWTFNPMNRSEKFNIKGSIFNFDANKMTPFIKPYLHATAEGNMKEIRFNFTGNDVNATGDFGIKYDNLKVTLYNKKTGEKQKTLSAVGNLLVKSNTGEKYHEEKIKPVNRNQDRSFFNFFWICVQQGLKQTLLII
ncbi:hypothetical protein [Moheibacter sediminis]|uniref:DUF748 domain-containing protein n=1 Tax=Moheibacter sediminis TaxID=1434700 RepID=A0A1W2B6N3_9FLAO|nr:hypothetical protein [Moheibacter sediminis]SMC68018.1 hypothetical protein SAMN06296427_105274 [Moheibacter sediminis]